MQNLALFVVWGHYRKIWTEELNQDSVRNKHELRTMQGFLLVRHQTDVHLLPGRLCDNDLHSVRGQFGVK